MITTSDDVRQTIQDCLRTKTLPEAITGILAEARLTHQLGKNILEGRIYLKDGIPNGTYITTTPVREAFNNVYYTRQAVYIVTEEKIRG